MTGREDSSELSSDSPAVLPTRANIELPLLAETPQPSHRPDTLDSRVRSLTPEVPLPERRPATGITPTASVASAPWSWESLLPVAAWVWLAGSALWFAMAALRVMRFERCRRQAELAPAALQAEARRMARQLGLACCPAICVVQGCLPPVLWAMTGKATILFPAPLLEQMPPSQQAMVVAHELAHFARRDHWFRWLELFVLGIYWWFPVAWWARRQLHHAAEQCCDAWVIWLFPSGARSYAQSLLETIDFLSGARVFLPVGASSLGQLHFHSLQRRFRMILSRSMTRRMPWSMRITAALVGMAILSFSARGVWGQGALPKATETKPATPATTESTAETLPVGPANNQPQAPSALPSAGAPPSAGLAPTTPAGVPPVAGSALPTPAGGFPAGALPAANPASLPPNVGIGPVPIMPFPAPQQNNVELRLQRLEAVTNQILQELRSLRRQNTGAAPSQVVPFQAVTSDYSGLNAAQLNAVDQQIRALAAEMKALQDRMERLQDTRAKLARQNAKKVPRSDAPVLESDPSTTPPAAPPRASVRPDITPPETTPPSALEPDPNTIPPGAAPANAAVPEADQNAMPPGAAPPNAGN
ncbi:MAG: M56 family metallopeptidase [Thermoguttaceae bacterium]